MKKLRFGVLIAWIISLSASACGPISSMTSSSKTNEETAIVLPQIKIKETGIESLKVGQTLQLNATLDGVDIYNAEWESGDSAIATVSETGLVEAIAPGEVYINCQYSCGNIGPIEDFVASDRVSFTILGDRDAKEIEFSESAAVLFTNDEYQIVFNVSPVNADLSTIEWSSSNEGVASVNDRGMVETHSAGQATITALTPNGGGDSLSLLVKERSIEITQTGPIELFEFDTTKISIERDGIPNETRIEFQSTLGYVSIDDDGLITAWQEGEDVVRASCQYQGRYYEDSIDVVVKRRPIEVMEVVLNEEEAYLGVGDELQLQATVSPFDADDQTVDYRSSDSAVASVSSEGKVTAVGLGQATITASTSNGVSDSCDISVLSEGIYLLCDDSVSFPEYSYLGEIEFVVIGEPDGQVTATTDQEGVIDVFVIDWDGLSEVQIYGAEEGATRLTVSVAIGGIVYSDSIDFVVTHTVLEVSDIRLTAETAELGIAETIDVGYKIYPDKADDKTIQWSSSDESVARVEPNGRIQATGLGTATITASAHNGVSASVQVDVVYKPLYFSAEKECLYEGDELSLSVKGGSTRDDIVYEADSDRLSIAGGVLTGKTIGEGIVTATSGGETATLSVSVVGLNGVILAETEGGSEYAVVGYDKIQAYSNELVILGSYRGKKIRRLASGALYGSTNITKLILGEGIEEIGYQACSFLLSLRLLWFPMSLQSIGDYAFFGSRSVSACLPGGVKIGANHGFTDYRIGEYGVIGAQIFEDFLFIIYNDRATVAGYFGDSAKAVVPESVHFKGEEYPVFDTKYNVLDRSDSNLEEVWLPDGFDGHFNTAEDIDYFCYGEINDYRQEYYRRGIVENVKYGLAEQDGFKAALCEKDGHLYATVYDYVGTIDGSVLAVPDSFSQGELTFPVETIASHCFDNLDGGYGNVLVLPSGLKTLGYYCLPEYGWTIIVPNSVEQIESQSPYVDYYLFGGDQLPSEVPDNLGDYFLLGIEEFFIDGDFIFGIYDNNGERTASVVCYVGDDLDKLFIPESIEHEGNSYRVTKIGSLAFESFRCVVGYLRLPDGLETIESWAFDSGSVGTIYIPASVNDIEASAFADLIVSSWGTRAKVFVEATSKPEGWANNWIVVDAHTPSVVWGVELENYEYNGASYVICQDSDGTLSALIASVDEKVFYLPTSVPYGGEEVKVAGFFDKGLRNYNDSTLIVPIGGVDYELPTNFSMMNEDAYEGGLYFYDGLIYTVFVSKDGSRGIDLLRCVSQDDRIIDLRDGLPVDGEWLPVLSVNLNFDVVLPGTVVLCPEDLASIYSSPNTPALFNFDGEVPLIYKGEYLLEETDACLISGFSGVAFVYEGLYYVVDGQGRAYLAAIESASDAVVIPETVSYEGIEYDVYGIIPNAFSDYDDRLIVEIVVPGSIEYLGAYAFNDFPGLKKIVFESGREVLPNCVRDSNSLEQVIIEDGLKENQCSFSYCNSLLYILLPETVESSVMGNRILFRGDENAIQPIGDASSSYFGVVDVVITPDHLILVLLRSAETGVLSWTVMGYDGYEESVVVPDAYDYGPETYPIVAIGRSAFASESNLREVVIGVNVTLISSGAFSSCSQLRKVVLPSGLLSIEQSAFNSCSSLVEIVLPPNLKTIGEYAFANCYSLESISIGANVQSVASDAFYGCNRLIVLIDEGFQGDDSFVQYTSAARGELYQYGDYTYVICLDDEGEYAVLLKPNVVTAVMVVPGIIEFNGQSIKVKEIGANAFSGFAEIKEVVIGDNIEIIGYYAFQDCRGLVTCDLPNTLIEIRGNAFDSCINLRYLFIPEGAESIEFGALSSCSSLEFLVLPSTIEVACQLNDRTVLGKLVVYCAFDSSKENWYVSDNHIYGCQLVFMGTEIHCSNGVVYAIEEGDEGEYAVVLNVASALQNIVIPSVVELADKNYPVREIGDYAFYRSELQSVSIPSSVKRIGDYAFYDNDDLRLVYIPGSVASIGETAFVGQGYKVDIYMESPSSDSFPSLSDNNWVNLILGYTGSTGIFGDYTYMLFKAEDGHLYASITGYNGESETINVPSSVEDGEASYPVERIGSYAFADQDTVKFIALPDSIVSIDDLAFFDCYSSVYVPSSVVDVGDLAFYGNGSAYYFGGEALVDDGESFVPQLYCDDKFIFYLVDDGDGEYAVLYRMVGSNAERATSLYIPSSVKAGETDYRVKIIADGFLNESGSIYFQLITELRIGEGIEEIGYAFMVLSGLKEIHLPSTMRRIDDSFSPHLQLERMVLPENLTYFYSMIYVDIVYSYCLNIDLFWFSYRVLATASGSSENCSNSSFVNYIGSAIDEQGIEYLIGGNDQLGYQAAVARYAGQGGDIRIPDCVEYNGLLVPVTIIASSVFLERVDVKTIAIGSNVRFIDLAAFRGCSGVETFAIPSNVKVIESYAFEECDALILVAGDASKFDEYWVSSSSRVLFDATGRLFDYEGAVYAECLDSNGDPYLALCQFIGSESSFVLPESIVADGRVLAVKKIIGGAFNGCDALQEINLNVDGLTIETNAIVGCSNLTAITIGEGATISAKALHSLGGTIIYIHSLDGCATEWNPDNYLVRYY